MGLSFSYQTNEPVPTEVRTAILAEADEVRRHWRTTERISFFQVSGSEDRLNGDSKVFPDAIAEYTPVLGEPSDARFIIDKLAGWSARFKISWTITAQGANVGEI